MIVDVNFFDLSLFIELIIIFSLIYKEFYIDKMFFSLKKKSKEVFEIKDKNIFEHEEDSLTKGSLDNLDAIYNDLNFILTTSKDTKECNSQNIWKDKSIKYCDFFKNFIVNNNSMKSIYIYVGFSCFFYLTFFLDVWINSYLLAIKDTVSDNTISDNINIIRMLVFHAYLFFLTYYFSRIIWFIYMTRKVEQELFGYEGQIDILEKKYTRAYDKHQELVNKVSEPIEEDAKGFTKPSSS